MTVSWLIVESRLLEAQSYPSGVTITCPSLSELRNQYDNEEPEPPAPKIVVTDIVLLGANQLSPSEQQEITTAIKHQISGYSVDADPDAVTDEVVERVRAAWQDRGYFNVKVGGEARIIGSRPPARLVSVDIHVADGPLYRLGDIAFKNNTGITDVALLRAIFPIKKGDVFSREKLAQGLEALRKTYAELGYINFTAVPQTSVDNEARVISLIIDMDEGKQFYFGTINIVGLDDRTRQELLNDAPIGKIYSPKSLDRFIEKYSSVFKLAPDDPRLEAMRVDEKTGAVSIILYACPCPTC